MRTWLITGCSSGMGAGIAKAVLAKGEQAVITARSAEKMKEICDKYPETALGIALDVCSQESIDAAFDAAVAKFGRLMFWSIMQAMGTVHLWKRAIRRLSMSCLRPTHSDLWN